jgi:altronate dehydratase small subunit
MVFVRLSFNTKEDVVDQHFGLRVHEKDNVATVFAMVIMGETVIVADKSGEKEEIITKSKIPYGHKIAVVDISKGESVFKYGEIIGRATSSIKNGEHVHIQNMESLRGRGDFSNEANRENVDGI